MQEYRGKTRDRLVSARLKKSQFEPGDDYGRSGTRNTYQSSVLTQHEEVLPPLDSSTEREFLSAVSDAMEGSLIRYSKRLELMAKAERMGIGRFQANLLIAQAQQGTGHADEILVREPATHKTNAGTAKQEETTRQDKLFLLAAIFIVSAIVDMVIVKFFLHG
jgi:hypothetical protein